MTGALCFETPSTPGACSQVSGRKGRREAALRSVGSVLVLPTEMSSLFVPVRSRQLFQREFREQCMHFLRRVKRIPEEVCIAVFTERPVGDAEHHT